jgi:hypothetical protein
MMVAGFEAAGSYRLDSAGQAKSGRRPFPLAIRCQSQTRPFRVDVTANPFSLPAQATVLPPRGIPVMVAGPQAGDLFLAQRPIDLGDGCRYPVARPPDLEIS